MRSAPVDGFSLAYDDHPGEGDPVVLLHGWPGDRTDYRAMVPLLAGRRLVVPDLRGFGESDKHLVDPAEFYGARGQAASVAGLLEELGIEQVVAAGYDVGSRVAQELARQRPDLVRALVVTPPLPGAGRRILDPEAVPEFWYQSFHQLDLAEQLIDGQPGAARHYLQHFWDHWSGPAYTPEAAALDALAGHYGEPGAFVASIGWYRAGGGMVARSMSEKVPAPEDRVSVPLHALWPSDDPLFPRAWSDRLEEFYTDVALEPVDGVGHFAPLEYPELFARAVLAA
ncbi:alpha/beta hydrolase [Nocardioides mangrovicus]|uniref:Alpha/beta hydrolase n=1 Tax=Nocardioides mangrovicus TaxID=2478913 RepID=A0A3L8NZA8_9ACTN|nr:alpha/beta hydrolase [Nocardioides mangrovicus]RLV48556.1 alpha/beta hydrolase [Nocardioides mangrovicus]